MQKRVAHSIFVTACLMIAALFVCPDIYAECPDWYDLDGSHVKCEIGPYSARQTGYGWTTQRVNSGPDNILSRHAVHVRDEEDPRTTNNGTEPGLHTVPAGEAASVRLGNWLDGRVTGAANETGQAERITYTFTVDDDNKYILLRYAIVWQDPHNHNDIVPSFQLETFLGATGNTLIDGLCYNFDYDAVSTEIDHTCYWDTECRICAFEREGATQGDYYYYSSRSNQNGYGRVLGYYYNGNNAYYTYYYGAHTENCPEFTWRDENQLVSWRDWRTRLINLEDYVGQTVRLRFTSSDCGYVEHWGYSYFTLRCLEVNMYSPTCGGPTETRVFTAPSGLNYTWFKVNENHTNPVRIDGETSSTLTVLNDGQTYMCYITSPENADCHISLYAKAEPRVPKSDFTINKIESCVDTIVLTDNSCVSHDGNVCIEPKENVDVVEWWMGDGTVTTENMAGRKYVYDNDGTYTITQITKLLNGNCTDTLRKTVTVRGKLTKHEGVVYDTICGGRKYIWNGSEYTQTGVYPYTVVNGAAGGFCDSIVRLHLKVWDRYEWNDTIDVLEGKEIPYAWHRNGTVRNLYTSGVYYDSCVSVHGCDSVYKLVMNVRPKHVFHEYDTICRGTAYPYHKNLANVTYTIANATDTVIYDSLLTKTYGNDSVYILHLHVLPTYHFTETRNFCEGDTVEFHGSRFFTDGPHTVSFLTSKGCDSTFTLVLVQKPRYLRDTIASISDKQKPFIWHGINCTASGTYIDSLKSVNGCDSIVRLNLTIYPTFFQEDAPLTLCKDSTIKWHTKYITGTTVGTTIVWDSLKNQYGYDSVYKATLTVLPSYRVSITEQRAIGETYYFFGTPITTGGVYTYNGTTERGCDSIVRLTINFLPTYLKKDTAYICEGSTYPYHKNHAPITYNTAGVYWDSLKTVAGYDSVYRLQLYVNSVYTTQQSATICAPATYDFFGQTLTTSGVYTKTLESRNGCDSTIVLTLTVNPYYDIRIDSTICEGESVMFNGETRTTGGNYVQNLTTVNGCGCDSITHLNLTVLPKIRRHHDVHLCTGEEFVWYVTGEHITSNRVVSDTMPSASGCDSINIWHIYAHEALRDTTYAATCQGVPYVFKGHTYTVNEAGQDTFSIIGTSVNGCDSSYVLVLTVNRKYDTLIEDTLCLGDVYTFNSKTYDRGGYYYDTIKTPCCGCDSTFIIHLVEYPRYFYTESYTLCQDSTLVWYGQTITAAGVYRDSLTSTLSHGRCDSIHEIVVSIRETPHGHRYATILSNTSYWFNEQELTVSGTYNDTVPSGGAGCDSIVTLHLTVLPVYDVNMRDTICSSELPYLFNGIERDKGGLYTETFVSSAGTDSVVHLTLVVWEPRIRSSIVHITDRQLPYSWTTQAGPQSLTHAGIYSDTLLGQASTGCDSINRLQLVVHPTAVEEKDTAICEGRTYYWHNQSCTVTGNYYDTLKNAAWPLLDSVYYHLSLTVNPVYHHDTTIYLCADGSYNFNGDNITSAGTYYDTIKTSCCGCDSTFILRVQKRPTRTEPTSVFLCPSELPYAWHTWRATDRTYSASGNYRDTLRTADGLCDSVYYTLSLTVKTAFTTTLPNAAICANKWYNFCGRMLNQPGDYDTTLVAVSTGCDSIVRVHLDVNPVYELDTTLTLCSGSPVTFNSRVYTYGGNFRDTLHTQNGCNCDSIYNITIKEFHPFNHTEEVFLCKDSTLAWHGQTITGPGTYYDNWTSKQSGYQCDSTYTLIVHEQTPAHSVVTKTIWSSNPYWFNEQELTASGTYFDTLPAAGNKCDSIVELRLTVLPVFDVTYSDTICRGEKYLFNGRELENGGMYSATLVSSVGTDSVVNLNLVVWEPRIRSSIVHITDRQLPYSWTTQSGPQSLTHAGVYNDTLLGQASTGCDSINRLQLVVHPTAVEEKDTAICEGRTYYWHNQSCTVTGNYYDTLKNAAWPLLDSVYYHLSLTVNPVYHHDTTIYLCADGSYNFNGDNITSAGTYYDTIKTSCCGCDSTFILRVQKRPTRTEPTSVFLCPSELPYAWHTWRATDRTYSASGNYRDTLRTADGLCDSVYYTLSLTVKTAFTTTLPNAAICANKWYNFCGRMLNQPGDYDTTLVAVSTGCDSIVRVHLDVNPVYELDTVLQLCSGSSVDFNGRLYQSGGSYRETLWTKNGCNCDSIYNVFVNEVAPFYQIENERLCKDSTLVWHGLTITEAGTYYDYNTSVRSGNKCDSTYQLNVIIQQPEFTRLDSTILSTQYCSFGDTLLNETGIYYDTLPAFGNACDSIVELHLTVLPVYDEHVRDTICRGATYLFNGRELENGGLYTETFLSKYGTDSVVHLTLVVWEPRLYEYNRHISDQQTYTWTKEDGTVTILDKAGTYDDTVKSKITGCDSIARLVLFRHPTYLFHDTTSVCENKTYSWRGNSYSGTGGNTYDFYDSYHTDTWNYDSIYHLHLMVNPVYRHDTTISICANEPYNFNGKPIMEGGTYYDTIKTSCCGCDSSFILRVNVRPVITIPETRSICPGDTTVWRGRPYWLRGDYVDTIPTKDGLCDSVYYTLSLRLKQTSLKEIRASICDGEAYDFCGRLLTVAGNYDTTLVGANQYQCDSVIRLYLTVNPTYDLDIYDTICDGRAVLFDNIERRTSGNYVYNGKTKAGCDSIVTLHLTVIAKQTAYIEKHLCEGDYVEINGERITQSGTYTEHSVSSRGCDSTTIWRVSMHKPKRDTIYKSICNGQECEFNGVRYRTQGIYVQEDRSRYNCDSTYVLVLTVNPTYRRDTNIVLCEHDFFTYNGHIYNEGGYYQDTARTKNGCNCDSILNITITKYPVTIITEERSICRGDSTNWRGRILKKMGTYDDTIRMVNLSCDSVIYRLKLTVNHDYFELTETTICSNTSVLFGGKTRNETGIYYDSLLTVNGCDSVLCLNLTVNPAYNITESVNRCDIEPYWYNGQWLRESGDYTQRMVTACGCDSIRNLHLTITPTKRDTVRVSLCEGEAYDYYGKPITQSGLYYDTINQPNIQRCIVSVMDIGFLRPTAISNVLIDEVCADDKEFVMRMYYSGSKPQMYSLIYDDKARAEGFVNVLNEPFNDVIYGILPQKENGDYVRPDYYTARMIMDNDICASAGVSAYEIEFLVKYPSWIIEQNWNDVVALLNERYNGGYLFSSYAWYVNGSKTSETGPYIYMPNTLAIGDEVVVAPTRKGEDYEVPSCPIVIYDKSPELVSDFPVLANATPIRGQFQIHAQAEGTYVLYSYTGIAIANGTYHMGDELTINTRATAGCYLLRLETKEHGARTVKLILW